MCKLNSAKGIVYEILFGSTGKRYIGQTAKSFSERYNVPYKSRRDEQSIKDFLSSEKCSTTTAKLKEALTLHGSAVSITILKENLGSKERIEEEERLIKKFNSINEGYNTTLSNVQSYNKASFRATELKEPIEAYDLDEEKIIQTYNPSLLILEKMIKVGRLPYDINEPDLVNKIALSEYGMVIGASKAVFPIRSSKKSHQFHVNISKEYSYYGIAPYELVKRLDDPNCDLEISNRTYIGKKAKYDYDLGSRRSENDEKITLKCLTLKEEFLNKDNSDKILETIEKDLEKKLKKYKEDMIKVYSDYLEENTKVIKGRSFTNRYSMGKYKFPQSITALKFNLTKLNIY